MKLIRNQFKEVFGVEKDTRNALSIADCMRCLVVHEVLRRSFEVMKDNITSIPRHYHHKSYLQSALQYLKPNRYNRGPTGAIMYNYVRRFCDNYLLMLKDN